MESKKIYKISIIVAVIVPLTIGFIYYKDISSKVLQNKIDLSNQAKPEIVFNKKNKIEGIDGVAIPDSNYQSASYFDFNVTYIDQNYGNNEFDLYLKNIRYSDNINPSNLKWRLAQYNFETKEYDVIFFGDFSKAVNGELQIGTSIPIGKDNFQKYRLYYYISYDYVDKNNYSDSNFYADIEIR